ncbi:MAG: hypothetical protein ACRDJC_10615 [Thermomicrobiales bacterium]
MSCQRLVAVTVLLGSLLLSALPSLSAAQTNAEFFDQVINGELSAPLLAGPFDFTLEQAPGVLSSFKAGVDTRNFVAHAAFTNPTDGSTDWDYGFQFRTTGDNEDLRIFVVSDGTWSLSVGVDVPEQTVAAVNLDTTPGAVNTLDLIVEEFQAIFGINGEFAGVVALPELDPTGDVYASTGFFGDLVVSGRIIELSDFAVYEVPSAEAPAEAAAPGVDPATLPARPVSLHSGSCGNLGEAVVGLREATYPVGDFAGQASAIVAETSFTRVDGFLGDLLAVPYAINVAGSFDTPDVSIACGDVGGIVDEIGGYVIGLSEQNGSGYRGVAYIAGEEDLGRVNISVFLVPGPPAAVATEEVVAAPAASPPEATPAVIAESDAPTEGTPVLAPVATPAA